MNICEVGGEKRFQYMYGTSMKLLLEWHFWMIIFQLMKKLKWCEPWIRKVKKPSTKQLTFSSKHHMTGLYSFVTENTKKKTFCRFKNKWRFLFTLCTRHTIQNIIYSTDVQQQVKLLVIPNDPAERSVALMAILKHIH